MRVLVIGGTGFVGAQIVRQLAALEHEIAIYNRGLTTAVLPGGVRRISAPKSVIPIQHFPPALFDFKPDA